MSPVGPERVRRLNRLPERPGRYVLYWMQQAQRSRHNDALDHAVAEANRLGQGVVAVFGLTDAYPEANLRHYTFLVEGLRDAAAGLARRGVPLVVWRADPAEAALRAAADAALVVCDRGYLRHARAWRRRVAAGAPCAVVEVEADAVVPVETASGKAEYAARTLRPKIARVLDRFLVLRPAPRLRRPLAQAPAWPGAPAADLATVLGELRVDRSVGAATRWFPGGERAAQRRLEDFLRDGLAAYVRDRARPERDAVSGLAMYLHFGHLSPVELACRVRAADAPREAREAFLEQLCVRRELANNFAWFTDGYDRYESAVPAWARRTLAEHARDPRPALYPRDRLEAAETADPAWNAAMREMRETGFLHNHLRMYWGKRILEWSASPEEAYETALALNNRHFLDGRDPSSFAGVGWVFGLHDRPWTPRPAFGTVRSMTAAGLARKCDVAAYVGRVARRLAGGGPPPAAFSPRASAGGP